CVREENGGQDRRERCGKVALLGQAGDNCPKIAQQGIPRLPLAWFTAISDGRKSLGKRGQDK
ncbi:MAG: hypothetical protein AAB253_05770, partial [candidate division NC10 bacterium]